MRGGLAIGWRILVFRRGRFIAATLGVAVAVGIMFTELGFFYGVLDSQARIAELVDGDLVVVSTQRTTLNKWTDFARIRLRQIAALPGVARAIPIYKAGEGLMNPQTREVKRIIVYAFRPDDMPLKLGPPAEVVREMELPGSVLFDRESRRIYGDIHLGQHVVIGGHSYRVNGFVAMGPNVINDGAVVMRTGGWLALHPHAEPIMGVLRLRPGADRAKVAAQIAAMAPHDVAVFTPGSLRQREVMFTLRAAPIGVVFGIGLIAGIVIGLSICYQVLFNEVTDHLPQYATLKAMGFSDGFIDQVVLGQALLLAFFGFAVGLLGAVWLYDVIGSQTALLMRLSVPRVLAILAITATMCTVAGWLATRRLVHNDPAALFRV